ncbi:MAG: TlpA disulfide reductase family protein [Chloroflexota bacterium]
MPDGQIRVAVPTGETRKKRRAFGLRDILTTFAIALFILGIVFLFNRGRTPGEGAFLKISSYTGDLPTGPAPVLGKPAPEFQLPLLGGGTFDLSQQQGKVVWIFFWATWCPPCRAEMPDIQKVWETEQGSDLVVIGVDFAEDSQTVRAFVNKLELDFPIGMDFAGKITTEYRIAGFPSHFFVDRNGVLREIRIGSMSEATMRAKLELVRSY